MFDVRRSRHTIPRLLVPVMAALIATLPLSHAAAITRNAVLTYAQSRTINFDDVGAPCGFVQTVPLTTQYATQGVTFSGPTAQSGGAIVNACGNFSVTGYSPPNFLAFNTVGTYPTGGTAIGPETITFAAPARTVSMLVGSATPPTLPGTATLTAYYGTTHVAHQSLTLSPTLTPLAVHAPAITSVKLSFTASVLVVDNLTWIPVR